MTDEYIMKLKIILEELNSYTKEDRFIYLKNIISLLLGDRIQQIKEEEEKEQQIIDILLENLLD